MLCRMADEHENTNGAPPASADIQLSEGKSLSFLATNVADPIDLGGLPPASPPSEAPSDASPADGSSESGSAPAAASETE
jgi:hypothetical protein